MEFEVKQDGVNENGKLKFETVESAFERFVCEVVNVPNTKTNKVVEIEIPSIDASKPPTKSTTMKPCLDSPAQQIVDIAALLFNQEQDTAYRIGYKEGFEDRKNKKKMRESNLTLATTKLTKQLVDKFRLGIAQHIQTDRTLSIMKGFIAAMQIKRFQGFANGYWQGYKHAAAGLMPQFVKWEDVPKDFE